MKREEAAFKLVEAEAKQQRADAEAPEREGAGAEGRGRACQPSATRWRRPCPEEALRAATSAWRSCAGSAVAEAKDGMCQICHVKLRPQMYVDV